MKMRRNLASLCLTLSCGALLTAANVSVGDQPGVIRMTSGQQSFQPPAIPPAQGSGSASLGGPSAGSGTFSPVPDAGVPSLQGNYAPEMGSSSSQMPFENGGSIYQESPPPFSEPVDYTPYMERSAGVTEAPVLGRRPFENPSFGPQLMFETNIDDGLGFNQAFHRANVRVPYHVVPGSSVLLADVSAPSITQARTSTTGVLYGETTTRCETESSVGTSSMTWTTVVVTKRGTYWLRSRVSRQVH